MIKDLSSHSDYRGRASEQRAPSNMQLQGSRRSEAEE